MTTQSYKNHDNFSAGCRNPDEQRRILYLAHDLDDAAIWRRVDMLRLGGAEVTVAGFRRRSGPLPENALVLGQTYNTRMIQRVLSVLQQRMRLKASFSDIPHPDTILCRNLEMLALAVPLRRSLSKGRPVALIYEVLDIHRLMVGPSKPARAMRWIERRLCRGVDGLIVSSPAFLRAHFEAYEQCQAPVFLVENKVVNAASPIPKPSEYQCKDAPLRIGWFGILRCPFSLHSLDALTRARPGRYQVILRGRPALDALPDFHRIVEANPDLQFEGSYVYPDDLARIYSGVDLAWLIDRYDTGSNSDWLLPNRLYESGINQVPPIAVAGTETARRLNELELGLILDQADNDAVIDMMDKLSSETLEHLRQAQHTAPLSTWRTTDQEARDLVDAIAGKKAEQHVGTSQDAVLIVVPTLNEAAHIAAVIDGLVGFMQRRLRCGALVRLVIADGGSTDGTLDIVRDRIAALPQFDIRLLNNPARIQSAAINAACARFGDGMDWLLRLDAHSSYPDDFADVLLKEAEKTGVASVVVSMNAVGTTPMQRIIALTQNTRLGNGGSAHRLAGTGRFVDHGHHALMRLDAFRSVGGYDESFSHNEDAELDLRLTQAGHRIWLTSRTKLTYFPRQSLASLFRQYLNFGRGRARTVLKHKLRPRPRQLLMISVAPAVAMTALASFGMFFTIPAALWGLACLIGGAALAVNRRDPLALAAAPIAATMHLGWSIGFWRQVLLRPPASHSRLALAHPPETAPVLIDHVAVGVCTHRRPELLGTLRSLEGQVLPCGTRLSIIVVDNDDTPTARDMVESFASGSQHNVIYRFAPSGNISIARNAALEEAERRELSVFAFIDDDEIAPPEWLNTLITRLTDANTDVVVGPVRAIYPTDAPRWMQVLSIHDTRPETDADGRPIAGHSCNVIMNLASDALTGRRFDLDRGISGGEDTAFFRAAMQDGAQVAFAPTAWLDEPVTPERATISWLLKRRFRMGQTHGNLLRQDNGTHGRFAMLPLAFAKVVYCMGLALVTIPVAARRNANLLRGALHMGTIASLIGFREVAIYGSSSSKRRVTGI
ncbi:glycosyltransferase [Ruegeria sp. SCPT10]|uniref:glycosyltransferase n=1 Tax=Ruegeria sp. SCP10 TaxID=3141377 RepID=UPI00333CE032